MAPVIDLPGRHGAAAPRSVLLPGPPEIAAVRVVAGGSWAAVGSRIVQKRGCQGVVVETSKCHPARPRRPKRAEPRSGCSQMDPPETLPPKVRAKITPYAPNTMTPPRRRRGFLRAAGRLQQPLRF